MMADATAAFDERADEFRRIEHSIQTGEPLEPLENNDAPQLGVEGDSSSEEFEAEDGEEEAEDEFEIEESE
jgi:hypothetical protein